MSNPIARPGVPAHLSPAAQQTLSSMPDESDFSRNPAPANVNDPDQWREFIAAVDGATTSLYDAQVATVQVTVTQETTAGVPVWTVQSVRPELGPIFLDFHGGALFSCGGELAWKMAALAAGHRPGVTWAPDYRMPPEAPYPAALDDAIAVYRAALAERGADQVIVCGTSAGGNLAAALVLRALAEGLPAPRALVLNSPELDLTESGDSFQTTRGLNASESLMAISRLYAAEADMSDPYLSPLFGDVTGFPPTLLWCGTRDFFLSNTVRFHRKLVLAGVPAELHVSEAMPHGGFGGLSPEDIEITNIARGFERRHAE